MRFFMMALALSFAAASCGRPAPRQSGGNAAAPSAAAPSAPDSELARALRAQAGAYYFDFYKAPAFQRFAPSRLGLPAAAAKRFELTMAVASPGLVVSAGGTQALVFSGCVAHDCASTAAVLAIDLSSGETFVGVSDEGGDSVLKPNPGLQKLLEVASPTHVWKDPPRAAG